MVMEMEVEIEMVMVMVMVHPHIMMSRVLSTGCLTRAETGEVGLDGGSRSGDLIPKHELPPSLHSSSPLCNDEEKLPRVMTHDPSMNINIHLEKFTSISCTKIIST